MSRHHTVNREELAKLPYFNHNIQDSRIVPLLPCFNDEGEWEVWLPGPSGLIRRQGTIIPVEGDYFAKHKERETDIYIEFLNFIAKRAYWPDLAYFVDSMRDDIHNLAASLEKIDLFLKIHRESQRNVSRFVSTETEYVVLTCRDLFDLLQVVISKVWKRVKLYDTSVKKKDSLPMKFSEMVLYNDQPLEPDGIQQRHGLPEPLAQFYFKAGQFFTKLRDYRVGIVHYGVTTGPIFQTPRGFAVDTRCKPFSSFNIWKDEDLLPNGLGSLRLLTAHIIFETLATCEDFAVTIQRILELPPDIAPDYKLFLRGYHTESLLKLESILEGEPWWQ